MLQLNQYPLPDPAVKKIRAWLGGDGSREFMDWLATKDAVATADASNLFIQSEGDPSKLEDAQQKAKEAQFFRTMIETINAARNPDFAFERCEIIPVPSVVITTPKS